MDWISRWLQWGLQRLARGLAWLAEWLEKKRSAEPALKSETPPD